MDILYLKILNPTLKFVETKSLFFKKYLYRIKFFAPGMRAHVFYKGDMRKIMIREQRLLETGIPNLWNSTWASTHKIDHNINHFLYKKIKLGKFSKYRIEFPHANIYLETENELNNLISDLIETTFLKNVKEISLPNEANKDIIADDVVLVKKIDSKYKFKVVINAGSNTADYALQRQNLMSYLYSLGDEIYKLNLTNKASAVTYYYYPTYFYCTDEKILVFLKLAYPDLIGKTFKVIKV